jgi:YesN/AraC family two-component response regulator
VLTATGGAAALRILRTQTPDLVLLDLLMPEVDGFRVLAEMRADPRTRHVPVVVLTGQALSDLDLERLSQGVALILGKGVLTAQETIARIRDILAHTPRLGTEGRRQVRRAMAYIQAHYMEPITRRDLAARLGLHEDSLSHYFAQEVGISVVAYLNRYRVQQARKLLEAADRSIVEIALAVGFGSHSYFTRVFVAETGMTPTAYRKQHRNVGKV